MKIKLRKMLVVVMSLIISLSSGLVLPAFATSSTQITSDTYTINHEKGLIFIPRGVVASDVKNAINNDNSSLSITTENATVSDSDEVVTGVNITLNATDGETLYVITIGDANLDGKLLVTDLVRTANNAVGNKTEQGNNFEAMDANHDGRITVSDVILARKYIIAEKASGYYTEKAYSMNNISYNIIGRGTVSNKGTSSEKVTIPASSGGIEFLTDCVGDVKLTLQPNKSQFVTVVVDGAEHEINLTSSSQVKVATGLTKGLHKIALYTQVEGGTVDVSGISLQGKVLDSAEKDLTIEFVGDSITAAFGNIYQTNDNGNIPGTVPSTQVGTESRHQNGFLGYGSIVGRTLDANFSVMAQSGSALMKGAVEPKENYTMVSMQNVYEQKKANKLQNGRAVDITIVALGANDSKALAAISDDREVMITHFKDEAVNFAKAIVAENGENAKVVFYQSGGLEYATYYGTSRPTHYSHAGASANLIKEAYKRAVEELAEDGIKAYQVPDLPCNLRGLYVHPLVEGTGGHKDIANRLVAFLKENVIND